MSRTYLLMIAPLILGLCACSAGGSAESPAVAGSEAGIEILGIHLVSGGDLVQLNYRVVDFEKAQTALRGEVRIARQDGTGGVAVMSLGRLGPMKQRPARSGNRQFMLFTNTGRALQKGETAVVILGERRIDGIPVT